MFWLIVLAAVAAGYVAYARAMAPHARAVKLDELRTAESLARLEDQFHPSERSRAVLDSVQFEICKLEPYHSYCR